MSPLVSVIMPVYNVEKYVTQALESIVGQTYRNLEIIVIDDGSTDKSAAICDEFAKKDNRIHLIHQENKGLAAVRNIGVKEATGKYIAWLDSDDWMELNTIEWMVNAAVENRADIVTAKVATEYVGKTIWPEHNEMKVYRGQEIFSAYIDGDFRDIVWNKLYLSSCYHGIRFPDGHNYEDVATTWKIINNITINCGLVVSLPCVLFHQRMRISSISNTKSFSNINDGWNAYLNKFEAINIEKLLTPCILQIGRVLVNYNYFSEEEKMRANYLLTDMKSFSKEHYSEIMTGKYPKTAKVVCLISQCSSTIVKWIYTKLCSIRSFISSKSLYY